MKLRTRLEMPFLLLIGMGLTALMTGVGGFAYGMILIVSPFVQNYELNGQAVTRAEFFAATWPVFAFYPFGLATFGAVAYALYRERPWSRVAMLAVWGMTILSMVVVQFMVPVSAAEFLGSIAMILMGAAVAVWYLYGKRSVREYYRAIESRAATASTGSGDIPAV